MQTHHCYGRSTPSESVIDDPDCHPPNWPKPPIWPEDLPLIRQLLTEEEYEDLLRRLIHCLPDGPLVDQWQAFGKLNEN